MPSPKSRSLLESGVRRRVYSVSAVETGAMNSSVGDSSGSFTEAQDSPDLDRRFVSY